MLKGHQVGRNRIDRKPVGQSANPPVPEQLVQKFAMLRQAHKSPESLPGPTVLARQRNRPAGNFGMQSFKWPGSSQGAATQPIPSPMASHSGIPGVRQQRLDSYSPVAQNYLEGREAPRTVAELEDPDHTLYLPACRAESPTPENQPPVNINITNKMIASTSWRPMFLGRIVRKSEGPATRRNGRRDPDLGMWFTRRSTRSHGKVHCQDPSSIQKHPESWTWATTCL